MSDNVSLNSSEGGRHACLITSILSIGYPRKALATGLCLTLYSGELTCLLGPNGVGKSTLINTLAGYLPPLSGEVLLGGVPLSRCNAQYMARTVSVVLTDRIQAENMTVFDLVAMGRSPYTGFWGSLTATDRRVVRDSLDMVGMLDFSQRQFSSLSDGEKQKVLIAKAFAQDTKVIILDEPTAFLDYPSKVRTLLLLSRLAHSTGKAVLLSTHDMEQSLALADSLWLMSPQHGVQTGSVSSLRENGAISACFDCEEMRYDSATNTFEITSEKK